MLRCKGADDQLAASEATHRSPLDIDDLAAKEHAALAERRHRLGRFNAARAAIEHGLADTLGPG